MTKEILTFMETCDGEFKSMSATNMYIATEKYSPDPRWHLDTMVKVLRLAGNSVPDELVSRMIQLISARAQLQAYAAVALLRAVQHTEAVVNTQPLVQIMAWTVGEYGELLLSYPDETDELGTRAPISEDEVIDQFARLIGGHISNVITREFLLTALTKLATRLRNASSQQ